MAVLAQNIRYGLRSMRNHLGLTLTILLTLALGVGANTAIFTVDYATLLQPLPYPHPEQLFNVWSLDHGNRNVVSAADFLEWKRQNSTFQDLNALTGANYNLATAEQPEQIWARIATPGYLRMLGLPMFLGRDFLPEEGQVGREHEVILTHKLWTRLGSNRSVIGTTIRLNSLPYTVVGVLPEGISDRNQGDLVVPLAFTPDQINHNFHWLHLTGRLKPGVTRAQASADMDAIAARIAAAFPQYNNGWGARIESLKNDFLPPERVRTLWMLLGVVVFVLLIACANVANLLLARSMTRQKEMAVRASLGASSGTLFGQLLTESLMLAVIGGILGVGVGDAMLRGLVSILPQNTLPNEADLTLNLPVLLFTLGCATLAGLVFGCVPAWQASRVDPSDALRESIRTGVGLGRRRLRQTLVVGEFAMALALLAGAGLSIHSFWNLSRVDLGVRTDHVLTLSLPVADSRSKNPDDIRAYYRRILDSIRAVPGVISASSASGTPLYGMGYGMGFSIVGGETFANSSQRPDTGFGMVSPDYFKTFGVRLIHGRLFSENDTAGSPRVAVVNEEFARQFLGGKDPLKTTLSIDELIPGVNRVAPSVQWQIVGVIHNVRDELRGPVPQVLVPFWQSPWPSAAIGVRTANDPGAMTHSITEAIHKVDPEVAVDQPETMEQVRDNVLSGDRFTLMLFGTFAAIALLLAATGIYGVMAFSVEQRSQEIALRMALGADRTRVIELVLREGLLLAAGGLVLGLFGSYFIGRAMQGILYGVAALDLVAFLSVGLVLIVAALIACVIPARRAASTEPMQVLRME
ncbi:ABC transporter permease [Silvibacterium acidisoli]|uniref:ABC transporter permease n=1 Tax=Acidobacteriaceae bacterium ZG23-2 TaxID=2883246 RepID=UPI00406C9E5B